MVLSARGRMLVSIISSYTAGFLGWLSFSPNWESWYAQLVKPPFTPPASVFFPVWMVLYGLMGVALGAVWRKTSMWHAWVGLFYVSLAFNVSWTLFFFGYHATFIALLDALSLAFLLLILALSAWEIDSRSSYLLAPYLAWVLFAAYLNAGIWGLN
jgi:tryptophan-rich sensory protein